MARRPSLARLIRCHPAIAITPMHRARLRQCVVFPRFRATRHLPKHTGVSRSHRAPPKRRESPLAVARDRFRIAITTR